MASIQNQTNAHDELEITYLFDAPRQMVFDSWLDPDVLRTWWAPEGYEVTHCEVDVRPGGSWRVEYRAANGEAHAEYGELVELAPPERLVLSLTQADGRGNVGPKTIVSVELLAQGDKTLVRFSQTGLGTAQRRELNGAGWRECFGKLERALATRRS